MADVELRSQTGILRMTLEITNKTTGLTKVVELTSIPETVKQEEQKNECDSSNRSA